MQLGLLACYRLLLVHAVTKVVWCRYVSGCNRQQEVTCRASLLRNAETLDEEWYISTYTGSLTMSCNIFGLRILIAICRCAMTMVHVYSYVQMLSILNDAGCVDTGCVDIRPVTQNSTQVATTWLEQMSTLESSFAVELSTGIRGNYVHRLATCHTHMWYWCSCYQRSTFALNNMSLSSIVSIRTFNCGRETSRMYCDLGWTSWTW